MTDEEMADEYASNYGDDNIIDFGNGQVNLWPFRRWSFLDGLKAGKPKWHDLRKNHNDLPPTEKGTVTIDVLTDSGRIAYYFCDESCWYDIHGDEIYPPPKAWCEIPEFKEE